MGRAKRTSSVAAGLAVGVLTLGALSTIWTAPAVAQGTARHHHDAHTFSGMVTSVGSGNFVLTESNASTITVDVNSSTKYSETGTHTAPSGVSTGERVVVEATEGTLPTATTITAARVLIELARVSGVVQAVGAGSFTVRTEGGLVTTVNTTTTTTYTKGGTAETGVTAGEFVSAYGSPDTTNPSQLDAQFVDIFTLGTPEAEHDAYAFSGTVTSVGSGLVSAPRRDGIGRGRQTGLGDTAHGAVGMTLVAGTVKSVTGNDIVVLTPPGSSTTVVVSPSTTYRGLTAGGLTSVVAGDKVTAFGTTDSAGNLDAAVVTITGSGTFSPGSDHQGTPATPDRSPGIGSSTTSSPWPDAGTARGSGPSTMTTTTWGSARGTGGPGASTTPPWNPGPSSSSPGTSGFQGSGSQRGGWTSGQR